MAVPIHVRHWSIGSADRCHYCAEDFIISEVLPGVISLFGVTQIKPSNQVDILSSNHVSSNPNFSGPGLTSTDFSYVHALTLLKVKRGKRMFPICKSDLLEILKRYVWGPNASPKMTQLYVFTNVIIFVVTTITVHKVKRLDIGLLSCGQRR